jgi:hypothetical protein
MQSDGGRLRGFKTMRVPLGLRSRMVVAAVLTIGLSADACAEQVVGPSGGDAVTPTDVLASPGAYLDTEIRVRGRVHVVRHDTLGPCVPSTGTGCITPTSVSLQLVTVGEPPSGTAALELYRAGAQGVEEPLGCKVIATNQFDCGTLTPDAVAVVSGRVLKHRIPTQQVQTPTGEIQVIRYREIYVLLVRP